MVRGVMTLIFRLTSVDTRAVFGFPRGSYLGKRPVSILGTKEYLNKDPKDPM